MKTAVRSSWQLLEPIGFHPRIYTYKSFTDSYAALTALARQRCLDSKSRGEKGFHFMATRSEYFHFYTSNIESLMEQSHPLRMIVVDDSPELLEVVCALLEQNEDVEIIGRGSDGSEALGLVSAMEPDLVLMDVQMPHVDGIAAAALITMHFPRTTVVLMSGSDSPELRSHCIACGAHAFIHKPCLGRELGDMIESVRGAQFLNYLQPNA